MPAARIRTRTSSGPGAGTGRSASCGSTPNAAMTTARTSADQTGNAAEVDAVVGVLDLGVQVTQVAVGGEDTGRSGPPHAHAEVGQLGRLVGVVAQQVELVDPERGEHLRGGRVVARILGEAQCGVGLVGVETPVLERVGVQLVVEPDAAAFLAQ